MAAATSAKPKAWASLGDLGVVDDLEQQVAQFLLERRHVVALDGVGDLVGFLDRIGRDRLEGLVDVPGAAMLAVAQPGHDGEEARHRLLGERVGGGTCGVMSLWPHLQLSYNIYYDKY